MCSEKPSCLLLSLSVAFLHIGLLLGTKQITTPEKQVFSSKGVLEILAFFLMSVLCSILNPSFILMLL